MQNINCYRWQRANFQLHVSLRSINFEVLEYRTIHITRISKAYFFNVSYFNLCTFFASYFFILFLFLLHFLFVSKQYVLLDEFYASFNQFKLYYIFYRRNDKFHFCRNNKFTLLGCASNTNYVAMGFSTNRK